MCCSCLTLMGICFRGRSVVSLEKKMVVGSVCAGFKRGTRC